MPKLPAFQFYPGDWLRENDLHLSAASTRGIWIDFLCHAWDSAERGVLKGTADELCLLLQCTTQDFTRFLADAAKRPFCDVVTNSHDGVTVYRIASRRMVREEKDRKNACIRQQRHRGTLQSRNDVTPTVQDGHTGSSSSSSSSSSGSSLSDLSTQVESNSHIENALNQKADSAAADKSKFSQSRRISNPQRTPLLDNWLRKFVFTDQRTFVDQKQLEQLNDRGWWVDLYNAINGFELNFLVAEFAKMRLWARDNPRKRPTVGGTRKFIWQWLVKAAERRRHNEVSQQRQQTSAPRRTGMDNLTDAMQELQNDQRREETGNSSPDDTGKGLLAGTSIGQGDSGCVVRTTKPPVLHLLPTGGNRNGEERSPEADPWSNISGRISA